MFSTKLKENVNRRMKLHSSGIQGMNLIWKQVIIHRKESVPRSKIETATQSVQYNFLFSSPKWQPGQPDNRKPFNVRLSQIVKTCIVNNQVSK